MHINYIVHLKSFFQVCRKDERLSSTHFSLYIALFDAWNASHFVTPFHPSREVLMSTSRIGSKTTYTKALDDLHAFGYIRHEKPKSKFWRSRITILRLNDQTDTKQMGLFGDNQPAVSADNVQNLMAKGQGGGTERHPECGPLNSTKVDPLCVPNVDRERTRSGTPGVPDLDPLIHKHINSKQGECKQAPAPNIPDKKNEMEYRETGAGAAAKNDTLFGGTNHEPPIAFPKPAPRTNHGARQNYQPPPKNNLGSIPILQEAKQFFASMRLFENLTAAAHREAMKFFNHYTAIGWKLGGLNPIVDWHAVAKKWILNMRTANVPVPVISKYSDTAANNSGKDYSIPF